MRTPVREWRPPHCGLESAFTASVLCLPTGRHPSCASGKGCGSGVGQHAGGPVTPMPVPTCSKYSLHTYDIIRFIVPRVYVLKWLKIATAKCHSRVWVALGEASCRRC